jgi:LEA14-like dessication related protein
MEFMRLKKIVKSKLFIVSCTIFCVGLLLAQTVAYPEFKTINSFEIYSFDKGIFKASVNVGIYNDNWFSIHGKEISFKMMYKKHLIAVGSSIESIKFQRNSMTGLPVEMDFYPDSMHGDLRDILLVDSIQIDIDLTGKFTFLGITSHKSIQTWLKTDDLINTLVAQSMEGDGLKLKTVKLINPGIQESVFDVSFNFKNTLNLPLELKTMQYSIFADKAKNNRVADWNFEINKVIQPNTFEPIEGEVKVNNLASAMTGFTKVLKGKLDYFLEGYALVAIKGREVKIPIKQHFLVEPLTQKITILKDYE